MFKIAFAGRRQRDRHQHNYYMPLLLSDPFISAQEIFSDGVL